MNLDNMTIASPCNVDWNSMTGDERVRHCAECKLNVYNLSEMSRIEAESLLREREGRLCVRIYQRADGTILTQDCPVGLRTLHRKQLRKRIKLGGIAAAIALITVAGTFVTVSAGDYEKCPIFEKDDRPPVEKQDETHRPDKIPEDYKPLMGIVAPEMFPPQPDNDVNPPPTDSDAPRY